MKKLRLDISGMNEEFFEDTRILGIISTAKNYRFCWQLNNILGYRFRLNTDIEVQVKRKERDYFFPVYEYSVPNCFLTHYLYHNHFDGEYLLPDFKHMDFVWLMKGDAVDDAFCRELIQTVKNMNGVQMVAELTHEKIKNKSHLIL